jgi:hypothetical protein
MIFHDLFTSINSKKAYHHLPRPLLGPRHFINRRVEVVATLTTWRWNISPLDSWLCLENNGDPTNCVHHHHHHHHHHHLILPKLIYVLSLRPSSNFTYAQIILYIYTFSSWALNASFSDSPHFHVIGLVSNSLLVYIPFWWQHIPDFRVAPTTDKIHNFLPFYPSFPVIACEKPFLLGYTMLYFRQVHVGSLLATDYQHPSNIGSIPNDSTSFLVKSSAGQTLSVAHPLSSASRRVGLPRMRSSRAGDSMVLNCWS